MLPPHPHNLEWVTNFCSPISSPPGPSPGLEGKGLRHRSGKSERVSASDSVPLPVPITRRRKLKPRAVQSHKTSYWQSPVFRIGFSADKQASVPHFSYPPRPPTPPSWLRISTVKSWAVFLRRKLDYRSHEAWGTLKIKEGKPLPNFLSICE